MNSEISPATLGLIGGFLAIVLTVGGFGYLLYNSLNVTETQAVETQYPTAVIGKEFGTDGVFAKTRTLVAPGGGAVPASTPVPVYSGDVGKSNLGSFE